MANLPENVRMAWEDRDGPAIFATVDENALPNIIYVTCVSIHGDDLFVVADNYFNKTRHNIKAGGRGALLFRDKAGKAYQIKGAIGYHTDGDVYAFMKTWNPPQHPGHAAASLRVEQVFSGGEQLA